MFTFNGVILTVKRCCLSPCVVLIVMVIRDSECAVCRDGKVVLILSEITKYMAHSWYEYFKNVLEYITSKY